MTTADAGRVAAEVRSRHAAGGLPTAVEVPAVEHPTYRPDIDGLRAIAVIAVVSFHAFPKAVKGGFTGVDVFFVISGFLITTIILQSLERGTFSFLAFYQRRIRRIFPALAVVMSVSFAFGWFALLGDEFMQFGKHMAAGAGFVSNFVLWSEAGYFDNSAETKPLLHLWSLAIEEQFYILWPLLLVVLWPARRLMAVLIAALIALSFALNVTGIATDRVATFFSPLPRAWELLAGGLLAWMSLRRQASLAAVLAGSRLAPIGAGLSPSRVRHILDWLSLAGFGLILFSFFGLHGGKAFPGVWAVPPVLGAVCLIAAGPNAILNRLVLSHPAMVGVGLISYPFYLWHWPLLSFARIVEGEVPIAGMRSLAVAVALLLAWLTYRAIERPLRFGSHGAAKALVLTTAMAGMAAIGFDTYRRDGHPTRASVVNHKYNKQELIRTPASDSACLAYVGIAKPLFHYCRYTDAGAARTIAVFGDSHAHVAYPGIAEGLKVRGYNSLMIANSGCPPFIDAPSGTNETEVRLCRERIDQLLGVLQGRAEIETVVMFTRGMLYLTGTEPVTGDKDVMNGATLTPSQFASGLQRTIDQLVGWGKTVYYVTENPELARAPEACSPRPFRSAPKDCGLGLDTVLSRQSNYRRIVTKLTNVTVIDSLAGFCPDALCKVTDDGLLLYADADHLSVAGSRFQARFLLNDIISLGAVRP